MFLPRKFAYLESYFVQLCKSKEVVKNLYLMFPKIVSRFDLNDKFGITQNDNRNKPEFIKQLWFMHTLNYTSERWCWMSSLDVHFVTWHYLPQPAAMAVKGVTKYIKDDKRSVQVTSWVPAHARWTTTSIKDHDWRNYWIPL